MHNQRRSVGIVFAILLTCIAGLIGCAAQSSNRGHGFEGNFSVDKTNLVNRGASRYFVLQPGYRLVYRHGDSLLTITVLNEERLVDGVQTRVVEEREQEGGALSELSRNYFALDPETGDVYYFGESVDIYKNGNIVNHEGSWASGENGAHFGLMMPGSPKVGQKFQIEIAPGRAMDRAEITSVTAAVSTPAGKFTSCVTVDETSPLEKGTGHKAYAPGIGLVRDDEYVLDSMHRP